MIRRLVICTLLVSGVVLGAIQPRVASAAQASGPAASAATSSPGKSSQPGVETGAKQTWSAQVGPRKLKAPGQATGISCATPTSCVAVGGYQSVMGIEVPLAESWNGESWAVDRDPDVPEPLRGLRIGSGVHERVVHICDLVRGRRMVRLHPR